MIGRGYPSAEVGGRPRRETDPDRAAAVRMTERVSPDPGPTDVMSPAEGTTSVERAGVQSGTYDATLLDSLRNSSDQPSPLSAWATRTVSSILAPVAASTFFQ